LVAGGQVLEASDPKADIAKIIAGMPAEAIQESQVSDDLKRVESMMGAVDVDGDRRIEPEEFAKVWPGDAESAAQKFSELDIDQNGFITKDEVIKAIQNKQVKGADLIVTAAKECGS